MTQPQKNFVLSIICFMSLYVVCQGRKHRLKIESDERKKIDLTTFGFLPGGELGIDLKSFMFESINHDGGHSVDRLTKTSFGFTLDKTSNRGISPDLEGNQQVCIFNDNKIKNDDSVSIVFFKMDLTNASNPRFVIERKGDDLQHLQIYVPISEAEFKAEVDRGRRRRGVNNFLSDSSLFPSRRRRLLEVEGEGEGGGASDVAENKEFVEASGQVTASDKNVLNQVSTTMPAVTTTAKPAAAEKHNKAADDKDSQPAADKNTDATKVTEDGQQETDDDTNITDPKNKADNAKNTDGDPNKSDKDTKQTQDLKSGVLGAGREGHMAVDSIPIKMERIGGRTVYSAYVNITLLNL